MDHHLRILQKWIQTTAVRRYLSFQNGEGVSGNIQKQQEENLHGCDYDRSVGKQTRDLLYVADAVDAIETALENPVRGTFNIGTGVGTSVNALFNELASLIGYTRQPEFGPLLGKLGSMVVKWPVSITRSLPTEISSGPSSARRR
jgi:hypothetical protein